MKNASWVILVMLLVAVGAFAGEQGATSQPGQGGCCQFSQPGVGFGAWNKLAGSACCASSKPAGGCCSTTQTARCEAPASSQNTPSASQPRTQPATCAGTLPPGDANSPEYWFALAATEIGSMADAEERADAWKLLGVAKADAGDFEGAKKQAEAVGEEQRYAILSAVVLGYAKRGDVAGVKGTVELIAKPEGRDGALRRAVSILCSKGYLSQAGELAGMISHSGLRGKARCLIAKKQALGGRMEEAKSAAEQVPDERLKGNLAKAIARIEAVAASEQVTDGPDDGPEADAVSEVLKGLAIARAQAGQLDEAFRFAGRLKSPAGRATAYAAAAEAMFVRGDKAGAAKAIQLAEETVGAEPDKLASASAYGAMAAARLKMNDLEGVRESVQDALETSRHNADPFRLEVGSFSATGKPALLGLRLRIGDIEDALAAARTPHGNYGPMDCYLIGLTLAETGKMDDLAGWLATLTAPVERAYACAGAGGGLIIRKQGDTEAR
jgi:tetratricopeptide (TPR) repeat protein